MARFRLPSSGSATALQLGFASILVIALVVLVLFDHGSDGVTSSLVTVLTLVVGTLFGYATSRAITDRTTDRVSTDTANQIVDKINGVNNDGH